METIFGPDADWITGVGRTRHLAERSGGGHAVSRLFGDIEPTRPGLRITFDAVDKPLQIDAFRQSGIAGHEQGFKPIGFSGPGMRSDDFHDPDPSISPPRHQAIRANRRFGYN